MTFDEAAISRHSLAEPLDRGLERLWHRLDAGEAHAHSPADWFAAVMSAACHVAADGSDGAPVARFDDLAVVALGAMEAFSVPAEPGTATEPLTQLGLVYWQVVELVSERGWHDGTSTSWALRIGGSIGALAEALLDSEQQPELVAKAGPAALEVAGFALVAASALTRDRGEADG